MSRYRVLAAALPLVAALVAGCGDPPDTDPPQAVIPEITIDRADAVVGSPLEMSYRFALLPGVTLGADYTVFVHFIDADGELMWTDDHQPPVATSRWMPGEAIEYARTMFVPKFPYEGRTFIDVGLYDPATGARVKMDGEALGDRKYRVAAFNLQLQSDAPFIVFTEGWHQAEVSSDGPSGVEWQWTRAEGTLAFKNPLRDAVLYLELDQPVAAVGATRADIRLGDTVIESIDLSSGARQLRKVPITAGQFGTTDTVTLGVAADRTIVPASMPSLGNPDRRELGVRVFRAYILPS